MFFEKNASKFPKITSDGFKRILSFSEGDVQWSSPEIIAMNSGLIILEKC